ncbi:peptide-methionine (R)-S-oxide reductase MsrB [Caulobacter sp. S45]|uniref:peptide-methionine (R)-S-oxide reductase MsrB n=1 Tax=Caulobacter sp. S45 TaxID=1641861 RepID=UPI0020C623AC|nr:peptide-methionine (R)-S-oxide reductase MsrB [Caulobacter sp. S45]
MLLFGCAAGAVGGTWVLSRIPAGAAPGTYPVQLTPAQWRARLSPAAFAVLREDQTEAPGASPLLNEHRRGRFTCAGCDQALYSSTTKFDSGTGWPSFYAPLPRAIATRQDVSMIIPRTEVHCSHCGGHLGHVFDDGPKPTGLRYCMNGVAMKFQPA